MIEPVRGERADNPPRPRTVYWRVVLITGDLRHAYRSLSRSPGFAVVVMMTLAVGIGASVTMFSVMHAVLWRPLPYPQADRLVLLEADGRGGSQVGLASAEIRDLQTASQRLELIGAVSGVQAHLDVDGELERVFAVSANDDVLPLLGAEPLALGRSFDAAGGDIGELVRTVVISDGLWRRRLGADPNVVGTHMQVNNIDVEIVGVLRPGLRVFLPAVSNAAEDVDVWFPRGLSDERRYREPATIARLKAGVTLEQAQAELDVLTARFVRDHAEAYPDGRLRLSVRPLRDALTADVRPAMVALGGAVGMVLLIACVNVASLMMARAKAREREFAVRHALGAGRGRLVRQLLAEAVILASVAGAAGLLIAAGGIALLDWLRPLHLPRQSEVVLDGVVALFAVALSSGVCATLGLVPLLGHDATTPGAGLKTGRSGTTGPGVRRLHRGLVVAEIALSILPLVAGGLMLRTFWNLTHAPIGFDPSGLITAKVNASFRRFPDVEHRSALNHEALRRVRDLPGVMAASAATPLPLAKLQVTRRVGDSNAEERVVATQQAILPGYLDLTRVALREGRDFSEDDATAKRPVVIIDERLARQLWPSGALGRRLAVQSLRGGRVDSLEVIGVTNAVRARQVSDDRMPHIFVPHHYYAAEMWLVIETNRSAADLTPEIRRAVEELGTGRPTTDIKPMGDYVSESMSEARFTMLVLVGFAVTSLLLAAVGLYGTLAYLTAQRTQEFGVRMALGASTRSVVRLVATEGAAMTIVGLLAGLIGALAVARGFRGLLYGVAPVDAATLLGVAGLIGCVAIAAASVPAWRAARVDPTVALRAE